MYNECVLPTAGKKWQPCHKSLVASNMFAPWKTKLSTWFHVSLCPNQMRVACWAPADWGHTSSSSFTLISRVTLDTVWGRSLASLGHGRIAWPDVVKQAYMVLSTSQLSSTSWIWRIGVPSERKWREFHVSAHDTGFAKTNLNGESEIAWLAGLFWTIDGFFESRLCLNPPGFACSRNHRGFASMDITNSTRKRSTFWKDKHQVGSQLSSKTQLWSLRVRCLFLIRSVRISSKIQKTRVCFCCVHQESFGDCEYKYACWHNLGAAPNFLSLFSNCFLQDLLILCLLSFPCCLQCPDWRRQAAHAKCKTNTKVLLQRSRFYLCDHSKYTLSSLTG